MEYHWGIYNISEFMRKYGFTVSRLAEELTKIAKERDDLDHKETTPETVTGWLRKPTEAQRRNLDALARKMEGGKDE